MMSSKLKIPNCPCKDCEKRTMNCHGSCEGYKEYRKKLDEINKENSKKRISFDSPNYRDGWQFKRKK